MMSDMERDELVRTKAQLAERLFAKEAITQEAIERERSAAAADDTAADEPASPDVPGITIRLDEDETADR